MRACAAASAVAVASLLAIAACDGGDDRVIVPDVSRLPMETAFKRICGADLTLTAPDFTKRGPSSNWKPRPGRIHPDVVALSTNPPAGSRVDRRTAVTVAIRSPENVAVVLQDPFGCD